MSFERRRLRTNQIMVRQLAGLAPSAIIFPFIYVRRIKLCMVRRLLHFPCIYLRIKLW